MQPSPVASEIDNRMRSPLNARTRSVPPPRLMSRKTERSGACSTRRRRWSGARVAGGHSQLPGAVDRHDVAFRRGHVRHHGWAQLERAILRERVKAGMERARREGRRLGDPGLPTCRTWRGTVQWCDAALRAGRSAGVQRRGCCTFQSRACAGCWLPGSDPAPALRSTHKGALRAHSSGRGLVHGR